MTRLPSLLLACVLGAGCTLGRPATEQDAFSRSGELIALSGAAAGARNACILCHGLEGEGDAAGAPRLAGLPSGYLQKQLLDYAEGRRKHAAMQAIASRLSAAQQVSVSDYYAGLELFSGQAEAGGPPVSYVTASDDLASCAGCHGVLGEGLGAANPPLAGQPRAYLEEQLAHFRSGERDNDPQALMRRAARAITPEADAQIAAYLSAIRPVPELPESAPSP
jgi:cytochrome c553